MRVQSETLKLERGAPTERYQKHESRHSAVWCEEIEEKSTVLFVKLSRLKSRPRGSLLRRTCTCHLGDTRCCVAHVVQRVLNLVAAGEKLFQFNGTEFRRVLRRLLTFLGHNGASQFTLKDFRAGRATSLAASGHSIGEILIAGEWKSSVFLRYCQADDLSVSAL